MEEEQKKETEKQPISASKKVALVIASVIVVLVIAFLAFQLTGHTILSNDHFFEYRGLSFEKTNVGNITFYRTSFPLYNAQDKHVADYNIYIRNDPRNLDSSVPLEGDIILYNQAVINLTENFDCEGRGVISLANLVNLYQALNVDIVKNPTIECSPEKEYNFIQIKPGEKTEVVNTANGCYDLVVNNCEILEVTEKMIVETLVQLKKENATVYLSQDQINDL